jgi:RNA polymerase sigma factor (sigma-70 family)
MAGMERTASLTAPGPIRPEWHDDADLAARFQAGETASFDQIVAAHQQRIARLVYRLLGEPDDVEDMVQEVFLSVLQNLRRFRGESKLSTWLTAIALNKCRSHRRRRLLRPHSLLRLAKNLVTSCDQVQPSEAAEIQQELRRAVQQLPARYREPIVLRYFEEMSPSEIGRVLGVSPNGVEVRLTRARRKLRKMLSIRLGEE